MKHVEVAIGIVHQAGWVLICQRKKDDAFADLWEFPGGKIEHGETPQDCVVREVAEELGIHVKPTADFPEIAYQYTELSVRIYPWLCTVVSGHPHPMDGQRMQWVQAERLVDFPFLPANAALIGQIIAKLSDCEIPQLCGPGVN
ncbi:MAG TPA: 8-oxo-dGTP diphosphatase MutT [Tepidisphaeraceae bacterium]|jgi:mutator protein MutT|nr:8-oxo-dGTP diphosphatase MutT [Tepidisphaeraceae bacterium]